MHYFEKKKGTRYQSLTTESWPFPCPQLTLGRINLLLFDLSCFDARAKYSNNDHLLTTISIHPVSCWFQLMPCTFFYFVLKRCLLPIGLIGLCFPFLVSKGGIHARMSFLFLLFLAMTQDLFLLKFLAWIGSWKTYLTFVCGYKWVLGSLQAGTSTRYPAIIETPGGKWTKKDNKTREEKGRKKTSYMKYSLEIV